MKQRILGIDPGAHGALAFLDAHGGVVVHLADKVAPLDAVRDALAGAEGQVVAYLELVGGFIPGRPQPASRAGVLMRSLGKWEGLLEGLGVRYILVRPQAWQAGLPGIAGEKEYARRKRLLRDEAIRRFPSIKVTLANCDALLIADYGVRAEKQAA